MTNIDEGKRKFFTNTNKKWEKGNLWWKEKSEKGENSCWGEKIENNHVLHKRIKLSWMVILNDYFRSIVVIDFT